MVVPAPNKLLREKVKSGGMGFLKVLIIETPPRCPPTERSVAVSTSRPEERSTGCPFFGIGHSRHGLMGLAVAVTTGPCQSKCTRPKRWPGGRLGSRSGMTCVSSADTVPVPYFTIMPLVGSSVMSSASEPGGVLSRLGNDTATGWLALALGGWKATMKGMTLLISGGMTSGSRSTGTSMAMRAKAPAGHAPAGGGYCGCGVKVVPAYTVTARFGIVWKVNV